MFFSLGRLLGLLLLLCVVLIALSPTGRVAVKSLLLLPDLFPTSPVRPLTWFTPEPRVETLRYSYAGGSAEADVYRPGSGGRHGALIVELGAWKVPKTEPALVRFANGMARAGAVVMIPESDQLRAGRVLANESDGLVVAFQRLRQVDGVDPDRVGFLGFSVGGGLAMLAAEDSRIREQVAFVNTMGGYFNARLLLQEIATREIVVDGKRRFWQPADVTLLVFGVQLAELLDSPTDRDVLAAVAEPRPLTPEAVSQLSPQGQALLRLLQGVDPLEFQAALAALPPRALAYLDSISPSTGIGRFQAPLYVMHDVGDTYIPYSQARYLVDTLAPSSLRLYTEFNIFQHVIPDKPVDLPTFAVDAAKLYRHVVAVGGEFL